MRTTRAAKSNDVRVDLYRDTEGKWRSHVRIPGHILADSGQGYTRRIDCLRAVMRVVGVWEVEWIGGDDGPSGPNRIYTYGQGGRDRSAAEFYVWHRSSPPDA